jgi:hypothetical protein
VGQLIVQEQSVSHLAEIQIITAQVLNITMVVVQQTLVLEQKTLVAPAPAVIAPLAVMTTVAIGAPEQKIVE